MKQQITETMFMDAFDSMGRGDSFTYAGLSALFEYLEEYENETGEELELDVIALCCDFTEYADLVEFQNNYGAEYGTVEDIEQATIVISIYAGNGSFIIQNF